MSYRIEISPNNRAGCSATHCKKEGIKITKGDIRQGVVVTFQEKTSFKFRHWGCVTPTVLNNWAETTQMDMQLVDGYEELPDHAKAKVKRALEQGHVDDDDWNGDIECNRYDPSKRQQGMFVKTPKKKQTADGDEDGEAEGSPTKKQATKKRGRAEADDGDEDDAKPAPKKAKGRAKKAATNDVDENIDVEAKPAPKKARARAKKAAQDEVEDEPEVVAAPVPAAKKSRAKKAKSAQKVVSDEDEAPATEEPKAVPPKKSRAKKGVSKATAADEDGEPEVAPPKKTNVKKGTAKAAAADEDDEPKAKQPPKRKGRGKKAAAEED